MAKNFTRKIKIAFDYNDVKEGVKATNNQLKMLNSEYKAVQAETRNTGKAIDMLANRKDYLNQRIKIINGSLEEYKKRLDSAKEKESAQSVEKYTTEITKAEQELRALQADLDGVNKKLDEQKGFLGKSRDEWESLSKKLDSTGKDLSKKVTAPIMAASAAAFKLGGDYEQALGKLDTVFQGNTKEIEEWTKGAMDNFGLSKLSATEMVADFGAMFDTFGFNMKETTKMSMDMAERVRDLGAFYNLTTQETVDALNAIFTGQVQPLKKFGLALTQAQLQEHALAKGINKKVSEMTEAEKVQLRYSFVMEKTSKAVGQFKKEHDTASTQLETFKELMKEIGTTFGETIIPIFGPLLEKVNNALKYIAGLDAGTRKFIVTMGLMAAAVGPILIGVAKVIDAVDTVSKTTKTVGKAIKGVGKVSSLFNNSLENVTFVKWAKWAALIIAVALAVGFLIDKINELRGAKSNTAETLQSFENITGNLTGRVRGGKMRGYAVGSKYIEYDQVAVIHKGEAVIPADQNPWNKNSQNPITGGGDIILNVNLDEVGEVHRLMETVKRARQMQRAGVVDA